MPLPELIEIVPIEKPVDAKITVPGSKSITNRALILSALSEGETILQGALWSEDTQVMAEALNRLGFELRMDLDPEEYCNRKITVKGLGGRIPNQGMAAKPLEIFVGNAGTAARFLAPMVCLERGVYRLNGTPRMNERPQAALFSALRELGYRIESPNDKLPAIIHGGGPRAGRCRVSIQESSQFASALLLCAKRGLWDVEVTGENAEESPYVAMTSKLMEAFPRRGGIFEIEPDASSGSYFWGAGWLLNFQRPVPPDRGPLPPDFGVVRQGKRGEGGVPASESVGCESVQSTGISVSRWPKSGWQVDADLSRIIYSMAPQGPGHPGGTEVRSHDAQLKDPAEISREDDLGDSIMTVAILAPFMGRIIRLTELGRLRLQETERVNALRTELSKCGVEIVEKGDTLTIFPSRQKLHGTEIETYNDHRMAMCFAILGLQVPGIKIRNPSCVKKTFPNFFQKLATSPPRGLGARILDGTTGKELSQEELFAE